MKPYVISPGEDVPSLASRLGFDADTVWNHAANATLKKLRGNPYVLASGDILQIPDKDTRTWLSVKGGVTNAFTAKLQTTPVSLTFANAGKPIACVKCIVHGIPGPNEFTTDGTGNLALSVPMTTREIVVEFPSIALRRVFHIGHLDPLATRSGLRQRLHNLGHHPPHSLTDEIDDNVLRDAVRSFQKGAGIKMTGDADEATLAALEKSHGV